MIFKKKSQSKTKTATEEIQLNIQSAGRYYRSLHIHDF